MRTIRQKLFWIGVLAVAALLVIFRFIPEDQQREENIAAPAEHTDESTPTEVSHENVKRSEIAVPDTLPEITVLPFASELEKDLIRNDDPEASRLAVDQILFFYRRMFHENPVGQNEEITAALLGENKERVAFIPPDSPVIKDGKLVDPWGTPYWFHPLSGQQMEIHSAGPDRELFTADDLPGTDPTMQTRGRPD